MTGWQTKPSQIGYLVRWKIWCWLENNCSSLWVLLFTAQKSLTADIEHRLKTVHFSKNSEKTSNYLRQSHVLLVMKRDVFVGLRKSPLFYSSFFKHTSIFNWTWALSSYLQSYLTTTSSFCAKTAIKNRRVCFLVVRAQNVIENALWFNPCYGVLNN